MLCYYKLGFDKIEVRFDSNKVKAAGRRKEFGKVDVFDLMHDIEQGLVGMDIVKEDENKVVFKELAEINEKEFDNALRRIFLLIKRMGSKLDDSKKVQEIDLTVNRLCVYCERILTKKQIGAGSKAHLHYSLVNLLEQIGDEYKEISKVYSKRNATAALQVNKLMELFYDCNYKFSTESVQKNCSKCTELKSALQSSSNKVLSFHLLSIIDLIKNGMQILIELNA